jgi:hypothetical protein
MKGGGVPNAMHLDALKPSRWKRWAWSGTGVLAALLVVYWLGSPWWHTYEDHENGFSILMPGKVTTNTLEGWLIPEPPTSTTAGVQLGEWHKYTVTVWHFPEAMPEATRERIFTELRRSIRTDHPKGVERELPRGLGGHPATEWSYTWGSTSPSTEAYAERTRVRLRLGRVGDRLYMLRASRDFDQPESDEPQRFFDSFRPLPGLAPNAPAPSSSRPATCADIRATSPDARDGEYLLYVQGEATRAWTAWCHDMAGTPTEYLTLARTGAQANFSEYLAGDPSPGTTVRTHYTRLRINPTTLVVDTSDQRFSTSTGELLHDPTRVTSMPYAVAMSCTGDAEHPAEASIDLRGTPFAVREGQFTLGGSGPFGDTSVQNGNQTLSMTGGGFCGWNAPRGSFNPFNQNGGALQLTIANQPGGSGN